MTQKHNQCQQLLCYHHVVAREDCKQNIMVMFSQSLPAAMSMQPFPKYINFTIKYQFDIYSLKLKKKIPYLPLYILSCLYISTPEM